MTCVTSESPVRREAHMGSVDGLCFRGSFKKCGGVPTQAAGRAPSTVPIT